MSCHRIDELLELLEPVWQKHQDLNLTQMLAKLAEEAGFQGPLAELTDDVLIYHLKMKETGEGKMIPGIAKDYVEDFDWKSAILKARGFDDSER
ncbi:YihD family protein [Ferrimonas balearica]|uniref:YihD family protein n=1 Tax=Ferrimonas balearica TaxID=44012 RepID=UPI001C9A16CE|nr:YihD family protein [Ferrimonas balearica]MBY5921560.1 YihD family protein [Ferrimonas balearica]MBY5995100.1 YihD family protein [Ferrimonas balearica]